MFRSTLNPFTIPGISRSAGNLFYVIGACKFPAYLLRSSESIATLPSFGPRLPANESHRRTVLIWSLSAKSSVDLPAFAISCSCRIPPLVKQHLPVFTKDGGIIEVLYCTLQIVQCTVHG